MTSCILVSHRTAKDSQRHSKKITLMRHQITAWNEGIETGLSRDETNGGQPRSRVKPAAQLKCTYTNACSVGNKQEELEAIVHQESYDIVTIMEMWWDDSQDWSAAMDV
ncbi:hypothetical protein BTVI_83064 [Pitangus sulphuratus]|nr:hypothetical protein BTVI_83064 [Pitangus sulphuratus]